MIIDSHVHFGNSLWGDFTPDYLINLIGEDVDFAICSNLEGIDSPVFSGELECNKKMLEISKDYPKLKPLFVCQPNFMQDIAGARAILENNPEFIGLKIHPECMKLPADNEKYDMYLELAREFKKP